MQSITKFRAEDGSEWPTAEEALDRDALNVEVKTLEALLGPEVKGGHRRAFDAHVVAKVKAAVIDICRKRWPNEAVFKHDPAEIHPMSFAGRLLSEVGGPLNRIWFRFCCMDSEWEYEQPYFALNPGRFDGITD